MKLYDFTRLIRKYSVTFDLQQETDGSYVAGKWVDGTLITHQMTGAIVPMGERKIYDSGGTYSAGDCELYISEALSKPLSTLKVIYNGNTYTVEQSRDFSAYADVAVYNLKMVSKKVKGND